MKISAAMRSAVLILTALLCGCAAGNGSAASENTSADTSAAASSSETQTETTAAPETAPQTEATAAAVSYPCEFSADTLHCRYDDKDIFGTLYLPANGRDKHPTVILSHGFNCIGKDMADMAVQLARNGVMAYTYDFCGGSTRSASSGDSTEMSVSSEMDELRHVIDMISALDTCDSSALYLYGESQGGFVSALTGAEMPDRISGMFLVYPAFSIMDDWSGKDPETMTEPFNFMGLTLSRAYRDGLPDFDVYEHIGNFKNHVHIYQGDKDYVANISYARKIDGIFPDSELTVFEGAGHGFGGSDRQAVKDSVCGYFEDMVK